MNGALLLKKPSNSLITRVEKLGFSHKSFPFVHAAQCAFSNIHGLGWVSLKNA